MNHRPTLYRAAVVCALAAWVPQSASGKPGSSTSPAASSKAHRGSRTAHQLTTTIALDVSLQLGDLGPDWRKSVGFSDYTAQLDFRWRAVGAIPVDPQLVVLDADGVELRRSDIQANGKKLGTFTLAMGDLPERASYRVQVVSANAKPGLSANAVTVTLAESTPIPFGFANLTLEGIRKQHDVPGLTVAISCHAGDAKQWSTGVRRLGDTVKVQPGDRWQIGSDTKAFTATMIGKLVEEGVFDWNTSVWDLAHGPLNLFPELKGTMHARFKDVTIEHLASHRSGMKMFGSEDSPTRQLANYAKDPRQFRWQVVRKLLKRSHSGIIGEWRYGHGNYMLLGVVIERVRGQSYEHVIKQEILKAANLNTAYFGMPTDAALTGGTPWEQQPQQALAVDTTAHTNGHIGEDGPTEVNNLALPPVWNPAGGLSLSMSDMLGFLRLHIDGGRGSLTLAPSTLQRLHTNYMLPDRAVGPADAPTKDQDDPSYGWGWGQWTDGSFGRVIGHDGTYFRYYASMVAYLDKGFAVTATANAGPGAKGNAAVWAARDWGVAQAKIHCKKPKFTAGIGPSVVSSSSRRRNAAKAKAKAFPKSAKRPPKLGEVDYDARTAVGVSVSPKARRRAAPQVRGKAGPRPAKARRQTRRRRRNSR